jgi:uncharacterized protein (DUF1778 family)
MPTTQTNSTARLNFRLPSDAKEKIERAAIAEGLTVTDFAVHALVNFADEVLERHHTRKLSDRDREVFLSLLDAEGEPNEALKSAFEAHRELIGE